MVSFTALLIGALLQMPPPAPAAAPAPAAQVADPKAEAARFYEEGITLFQTGEYSEAASRFQQAYNFDPAPNLLFNLARALELSGDKDEATLHYKAYLARHPGAEDEAEVKARIAELEGKQPASTAATTPRRAPGVLADHLQVEAALMLTFGGAFETDELTAGGASISAGDPDLGVGFGVGGGMMYEAIRRVWVGGRLRWSATELDDDLLARGDVKDTGQARHVDLSAEARYVIEVEGIRLHGTTWLGPSWLSGEVAVPRASGGERDVSISGFGWHWGAGVGGAWPLKISGLEGGALEITGLLGVLHHSTDLSGELEGDDAKLKADPVSSTRLLLEFGAAWRW